LRIFCHGKPAVPAREYAVDTCVVAGPPDANGVRAEYIVAWTHAKPAPVSHLDRIAPALSTALSRPAHATTTIEAHGGDRP
jgi:hypothetical protein